MYDDLNDNDVIKALQELPINVYEIKRRTER